MVKGRTYISFGGDYMINVSIPRKNHIQLPAVTINASYNIPTPGKFVCNASRVNVTELDLNSIYLISGFSFSTSIAESLYLTAIDPTKQLKIQLFTKKNLNVFKYPIPLLKYHENSELNAYVRTSNSTDFLQISGNGEFYQVADLIGITNIVLSISFFLYQIDSNEFNKYYNEDLSKKGE